jgi:hypothetical protein
LCDYLSEIPIITSYRQIVARSEAIKCIIESSFWEVCFLEEILTPDRSLTFDHVQDVLRTGREIVDVVVDGVLAHVLVPWLVDGGDPAPITASAAPLIGRSPPPDVARL